MPPLCCWFMGGPAPPSDLTSRGGHRGGRPAPPYKIPIRETLLSILSEEIADLGEVDQE